MTVFRPLAKLLKDPPPSFAFELSEAGIACARIARPPQFVFQEIEADVLAVSPVRDNVLRPEAILSRIRALEPGNGSRKRRGAGLILPDYSVRVCILDFDAFPSAVNEQISLLRFRLKRSVPFDVDSATLSYWVQGTHGRRDKKLDVVAAIAPAEVVGRYEALFDAAGFHTGWITTSTLAALQLVPLNGLKILVKRSGRMLSIAVQDGPALKLLRTIELAGLSLSEVVSHLYPTLAYVEDELAVRPELLLLCGFESFVEEARERFSGELGIPAAPLRSRFGEPGEYNAGLLGYVESVEEL